MDFREGRYAFAKGYKLQKNDNEPYYGDSHYDYAGAVAFIRGVLEGDSAFWFYFNWLFYAECPLCALSGM